MQEREICCRLCGSDENEIVADRVCRLCAWKGKLRCFATFPQVITLHGIARSPVVRCEECTMRLVDSGALSRFGLCFRLYSDKLDCADCGGRHRGEEGPAVADKERWFARLIALLSDLSQMCPEKSKALRLACLLLNAGFSFDEIKRIAESLRRTDAEE